MDKIKFSFGETEFITSRMSGTLPYVEPETVDGLPVRVVHEVILKMRKCIIREYGLE